MSDALERIKDAREALDAMDDLARMDTGVNPIGPRRALEQLISEHESLLRRVAEAPVVAVTECNQVPGAADFDHGDLQAACQQFEPGQRVRILAEPEEVGS